MIFIDLFDLNRFFSKIEDCFTFKTMEIMYTGYIDINQLITWLMVVNQLLPYILVLHAFQPQQQKIHFIMIVNG